MNVPEQGMNPIKSEYELTIRGYEKEEEMKNETTTDRITDLVNRFDDDIQQLAKEFGANTFASSIDVSIQNIPLEVFHSLTDGMDVRVKMYDVSEGIPCLETKYKVGSWGWVNLSSNPIRERLDEDER